MYAIRSYYEQMGKRVVAGEKTQLPQHGAGFGHIAEDGHRTLQAPLLKNRVGGILHGKLGIVLATERLVLDPSRAALHCHPLAEGLLHPAREPDHLVQRLVLV